MAPNIGQIIAVSYPAVVNEKKKPANQWAESAFLRELERQGGIKRESLGSNIEMTLDYQRNPGTVIQTSPLQPLSLTETEVLDAAQYDIGEVTAPIVWSKRTEVQNPTVNQKVNIATALMENAIESHDDILEQTLLGNTTNGLIGLLDMVTIDGLGTVGTISANANTWWRNVHVQYTDDTDIEAALTSADNSASKGSGSKMTPSLIVSDGAQQALFEGTQQANQRWIDTDELKAGFKIIAFKRSRWVFSQYGSSTRIFGLNPKNYMLVASKDYFRDLDDTLPITNANGFVRKIYSALQAGTNNRSRLYVVYTS